jgi:hypothetical protein
MPEYNRIPKYLNVRVKTGQLNKEENILFLIIKSCYRQKNLMESLGKMLFAANQLRVETPSLG